MHHRRGPVQAHQRPLRPYLRRPRAEADRRAAQLAWQLRRGTRRVAPLRRALSRRLHGPCEPRGHRDQHGRARRRTADHRQGAVARAGQHGAVDHPRAARSRRRRLRRCRGGLQGGARVGGFTECALERLGGAATVLSCPRPNRRGARRSREAHRGSGCISAANAARAPEAR